MTEDEMIGWHHRLDGPEFEQAPGVGDGQGSLACCSLWGLKGSDTNWLIDWTELNNYVNYEWIEQFIQKANILRLNKKQR